jgi:hypothetical protein
MSKNETKETAIQSRWEITRDDWVCIRYSWLKDSDSDPEEKHLPDY